jgi:hypothetical protein
MGLLGWIKMTVHAHHEGAFAGSVVDMKKVARTVPSPWK